MNKELKQILKKAIRYIRLRSDERELRKTLKKSLRWICDLDKEGVNRCIDKIEVKKYTDNLDNYTVLYTTPYSEGEIIMNNRSIDEDKIKVYAINKSHL